MRKTLLIAAAALAASVISSEAQVYSQNIVGYVNIPATKGFNNIANPLDCGNSLTNIIAPGATWDFTSVSLWNGSGYTTYTIDSNMATGVADAGDNAAVTSPTILPGKAFFFNNNSGSSNTITVVGSVHVDAAPTGSQTVGTATNSLGTSPQLNFYGSVIPVGGELGSIGFPTNGPADFATVQIPLINASGSITGFQAYTVDSSLGGWADAGDNAAVPGPVINVGKGFFFANNTGSPVKWVQAY